MIGALWGYGGGRHFLRKESANFLTEDAAMPEMAMEANAGAPAPMMDRGEADGFAMADKSSAQRKASGGGAGEAGGSCRRVLERLPTRGNEQHRKHNYRKRRGRVAHRGMRWFVER